MSKRQIANTGKSSKGDKDLYGATDVGSLHQLYMGHQMLNCVRISLQYTRQHDIHVVDGEYHDFQMTSAVLSINSDPRRNDIRLSVGAVDNPLRGKRSMPVHVFLLETRFVLGIFVCPRA